MATLDDDDKKWLKQTFLTTSKNDIEKIRKSLKPDFDKLATKLDLELTEKNIKKEIKQYIHEGVNSVVNGVDNLLSEYQYDERIKKLENIHPQGRHRSID